MINEDDPFIYGFSKEIRLNYAFQRASTPVLSLREESRLC